MINTFKRKLCDKHMFRKSVLKWLDYIRGLLSLRFVIN